MWCLHTCLHGMYHTQILGKTGNHALVLLYRHNSATRACMIAHLQHYSHQPIAVHTYALVNCYTSTLNPTMNHFMIFPMIVDLSLRPCCLVRLMERDFIGHELTADQDGWTSIQLTDTPGMRCVGTCVVLVALF